MITGVRVSSIVNEVTRIISNFFTKNVWAHKSTNQTKANLQSKHSEQKTTKATIFCAKKTSGREEIGYFAFNFEIVLITSFTILLLKKRPIKVIVLFQT